MTTRELFSKARQLKFHLEDTENSEWVRGYCVANDMYKVICDLRKRLKDMGRKNTLLEKYNGELEDYCDSIFKKLELAKIEIDRLLHRVKENAQNTEQWISVMKRLPENRNPVLVCLERDCYDIGTFYEGRWQQDFYGEDVTHWMPLPPFPEKRTR